MTRGGFIDVTGVAASWLCVAHCVLLPFAVTLLPLVGLGFLLDESVERILIGLSIVVAGISLVPAYFRDHKRLGALLIFAGGISLIIATHLLLEENWVVKATFFIAGAALITTAHFINRRLCRECRLRQQLEASKPVR